jgi:glyoxylase-like metal-dependent hydrolase (beta-lactamase superfamily II)
VKILLSGVLILGAAALSPNECLSAPLEVQVIPTTATSMYANVALIKGEKAAVLVDVPFSRADAHRVVAEILDSGKALETIVITHDHPDHFFGLDVLTDAFPNAKVVAHPLVARDIQRSVPIKFKRWSSMLGMNAPQRQVVPSAVTGDAITLEGHALEIIGPMQGDHVHATAVWDPETKILIAGDLVYNGVYVWLGEHRGPQYQGWLASLDVLQAMRPSRIVAGHTRPGLPDDSHSIDWTRQYILAFRKAATESKTSKELGDRIRGLYPNAVDVAGGFLVGVSSQVGVGEIPPWNE